MCDMEGSIFQNYHPITDCYNGCDVSLRRPDGWPIETDAAESFPFLLSSGAGIVCFAFEGSSPVSG